MTPSSVLIYPNVTWYEENSTVGAYVILGEPPRHHTPGELALMIGEQATLRSFTIIYAGNTIGARLQTGHHVTLRENNQIGDDVSIGTSSVLEYGNRIGHRTRIHSGCFLELVTLGNDVFVGPNVVFTDDPHPVCPRYQDCKGGPVVGDLSRIGANSTLLPGVKVGKNCLIGAGSVVTENIPDDSVAVGNPARVVKSIHELTCEPGFFERPYDWLKE